MSETYKSALEFIRWNYPTEKHERLKLSTDKAIEALKKQIPKEPSTITKETNGREFKLYFCSSCYVKIESEHKYCINCGQKLDWD